MDIPEGATKAEALKIITENNSKGQEALDKLSSCQLWYKHIKESEKNGED